MKKSTLLAALSLLLMTGCAESNAPGTKHVQERQAAGAATWAEVQRDAWPEKVPSGGLVKGLVLPLEKYLVSYSDEVAFTEGRSNAELKCMRDLGFTDWRVEVIGSNPPIANNSMNMPRRYGLADLADAKANGYRAPSKSGAADANDELAAQETPEAVIALTGKDGGRNVKAVSGKSLPDGGCRGESIRQVPSPDYRLAEALSGESFTKSQADPAVASAMADWSSCMSERGYRVENVWDAADNGSTSPKELELAIAEVECKQKANLVTIWYNTEKKIQETLIAEHASKLNASKESTSASLRAARNITATIAH